jgi:hypothetical protein
MHVGCIDSIFHRCPNPSFPLHYGNSWPSTTVYVMPLKITASFLHVLYRAIPNASFFSSSLCTIKSPHQDGYYICCYNCFILATNVQKIDSFLSFRRLTFSYWLFGWAVPAFCPIKYQHHMPACSWTPTTCNRTGQYVLEPFLHWPAGVYALILRDFWPPLAGAVDWQPKPLAKIHILTPKVSCLVLTLPPRALRPQQCENDVVAYSVQLVLEANCADPSPCSTAAVLAICVQDRFLHGRVYIIIHYLQWFFTRTHATISQVIKTEPRLQGIFV